MHTPRDGWREMQRAASERRNKKREEKRQYRVNSKGMGDVLMKWFVHERWRRKESRGWYGKVCVCVFMLERVQRVRSKRQ